MKIDCLMGTYGRYSLACEALACFLQQTALEQATLLIYNQHPTPLAFDHPRVRVVNEALPDRSLRDIKYRMLELADPSADLIHWWDDDDLCLPWHLEDCLRNIGDNAAWRPARSWYVPAPGEYLLESNIFEGTTTYRPEALNAVPRDAHPRYPDHPGNYELYLTRRVATTEMGDFSSYIYRWDSDDEHVSQHLNRGKGPAADLAELRASLLDGGPGGPMTPGYLWPHWQAFLAGVQSQVSEANHREIYTRLAFADAKATLLARHRT